MADVEAALSEGYDLLDTLAALLVVPAAISLLNVGELQAVLGHRGGYVGVELPFPVPVGDLWTFVNTPQVGGGVVVSAPGFASQLSVSLAVLVAVGYLLVYALLAAGYLGSIQQFRVEGTYDFAYNAGRYARRYVVLTAVLFGSLLVLLPLVLAAPPLILVVDLLFLAIGYLFWGAWFLVPVADVGAIEALGRSYGLATAERDYAVWTLAHVVLGGAVSLPATWLAVQGSLLGVFVALAVAVPVGFILTVGSLRTIDDLTGGRGQPRSATPAF